MSADKPLNARQTAILKLIEKNGVATIDELVEAFDVTPQTLRRDLNLLADYNLIQRFHGGATSITSTENLSYQDRQIRNLEEKEAIAREIALHVPDHSSMFINIGTTTETIAKALMNHKGLQVVTNNLHVASMMSKKEDFRVIVTSGEVRARDGGIVGEATMDFVQQFRLDFGIIGISAIDEDGALLDYDYREVRVAQAIIQQSRHVFLAADHSKFGRRAMVRLGSITQANMFFTDQRPSEDIETMMKNHDVRLHICTP
ncbi:DeoR/GlpR family transcriptional regulator [Hahella sp. KA22]|uniref:DeoR/GlpR family transcriptional regulator n=1 Tax=Hahella sp. KA22 TaxID=1628392 RepID=UPI000FDD6971|nr:DeoR/GlpR family transcriptional regulator [Hahella sp. KA22]AZZ95264.1 DeoR/GlpR family transcriptional regulator [Hahella sp. KA22]QAY52909.1 DeoR/GlpR family transcriptional regulator [Hahella sp. KA22]